MIIFTLLLSVWATSNFESLFKQWEEQIKYSDIDSSICDEILNNIELMPKVYLSRFYRMYAQYIFYGLDGQQGIDFARALYYFKRSADMGNAESLFYVSLMTSLQLDGSYNIWKNLQNKPESLLYQYVSEKYLSVSLVDLYFSAMQGNKKASVAIAYRHLKGVGVEKNCSNAASFYLPVLEEFANSPNSAKYMTSDKKVAYLMYNGYFYSHYELGLRKTAVTLQNSQVYTSQDYQQVSYLAKSYYYGLNGLPRDYAKAYRFYELIYEQRKNDLNSRIQMAQMIIDGLGVDKPDYVFAMKLLKGIETNQLTKEQAGIVYNAIGYMHFKGLGVDRDIPKAQDYFVKSAEFGDSNGLFNLGSLYLLPSTLERERNRQKGVQLIEQAANKGHAMAQYSLALIYLDGVDLYYSCDLAADLMHFAATRGPWADLMNTANFILQQDNRPQSLIKYFESEYVGQRYGAQNSAVLLEYKDAFYYDELHFLDIQSRLDKDPAYDKSDDAFRYLYSDYLQFVNMTTLQELLQLDSHSLNGRLQFKYLKKCQNEPICIMKLGDFYYKGIYREANYHKAMNYYSRVIKKGEDLVPSMKGHIYFNLGLMYYLGLGTIENETKSFEMFEQSIKVYPLLPFVPQTIQVQGVSFGVNLYKQILQVGINEFLNTNYLEVMLQTFTFLEDQIFENLMSITNVSLLGLFVFFFGIRLRWINQNK